jgi:Saxitoxin biosynthesis operon protein SxtJ
MKLNLKDEPKEWRKSALLAALGLALLSSVLRWRHVLTNTAWLAALAVAGLITICALLQPRWFAGYHRISMRLGFAISQFMGRVALALFFFFILTPVGLILRLAGKDPLQLKPPHEAKTCWQPVKNTSPLDRLF